MQFAPIIGIVFFTIFCRISNGDICELCNCTIEHDNNVIVLCQSEIKNNITIELDNIQWPSGNVTVNANFNDLKFSFLPKVLGSLAITTINLDNNLIDSMTMDPFQHCKNIEIISISNNSLTTLPKDFVKSTKLLRQLNLAKNFLSNIDNAVLAHLHNLTNIDISYNKLTTVSTEIMTLQTVKTLNLAGNLIFVVENSNADIQTSFRHLNLSKNKFTMIATTTFNQFPNLENLNLAINKITNIESEAFSKLTMLKTLNLSNNKLEDLSLNLPDSLEHLILSFNFLHNWPMHNLPMNLRRLDVQYNNLFETFNSKWIPENLQILNASHNSIEQLTGQRFPSLIILDLSNNQFNTIPHRLSERAPTLDTLILDHNPIETIVFDDPISVRRLSFRHMPILKEINANDLKNINSNDCLDLTISHCPNLIRIVDGAFDTLSLCKLDLSYNSLSFLPPNLTEWMDIDNGINLQGNPFICNCSSQWMLDVVLKLLYSNVTHQHYLANLRCASPKPFTGHRFVKYYKKKAAFCNPNAAMILSPYMRNEDVTFHDGDLEIFKGQSSTAILIVVICAILLIILVAVGVYLTQLQQKKRARKNRRYPLY